MRTFLIGGGRDSTAAHAAFVQAAGGPIVVYLLLEEDIDVARWKSGLIAAGAETVSVVVVSGARLPDPADLQGAAGVYVAGGLTPGYHDVLVDAGTGWLDAARAAGLVYGGFSAGAAIAARSAMVGGFRASLRGRQVDVCDPELAESIEQLTVRPGLGLVPFMVDVHAGQWGTLYRLVHGVLGSEVDEGWAIDEATAVEVNEGRMSVHGTGAATRVRRAGRHVEVSIHLPGEPVS